MSRFLRRFVTGAVIVPLIVGLVFGATALAVSPFVLMSATNDWRWIFLAPVVLAFFGGLAFGLLGTQHDQP